VLLFRYSLLLRSVEITIECTISLQSTLFSLSESESEYQFSTDGQSASRPVCLGNSHPSWACDQIFITVWQLRSCFCVGALSHEKTGLSFVYAAGPCQRSPSRVRVPCYSRPYITVSNLGLPFSSPPTTRRVMVEVFEPASTRAVIILIFLSYKAESNEAINYTQNFSNAVIYSWPQISFI
jgi:hypothetical protein